MSKKRLTIAQLAARTGQSVDGIRIALSEGGVDVSAGADILRGRERFRARRVLGLISPDHLLVSSLAEQAGLQESEARSLLYEKGVLRKKRLKRVPASSLTSAKRALGILKPETQIKQLPATAVLSIPPKKKKELRQEKNAWPSIGKKEELMYLTVSDVEEIHSILVNDFKTSKDPISPPGVRDRNLLESAVFRPYTSCGVESKYPTVSMSSAALLHSVVFDHPFFNGNKRTALVSMLVLLDKNGWVCTLDQDGVYDFVIALAAHKLISGKAADNKPSADDEVLEVARWLQRNIRKIQKSEQVLKFREVRNILSAYGCKLEHPKGAGNRINISNRNFSIQIAYRNEGSEVAQNTIHTLRAKLGLDEQSGYDSDIFYNKGSRIPKFINQYRKALDRLAKV